MTDSSRLRRWLAQVGSVALAAGLLYLALRGVDLARMWEALRAADYRWLPPLVALALLSHTIRAWRWTLLLGALPRRGRAAAPRPASVKTAFYSLMIGYMVNYVTPRLGELVRAGNQALQEERSFSGVLGTVVAERVLGVLVLALALLSTLVLFADRLTDLDALFFAPARDRLGRLPVGAVLLVSAGPALLLGALLWWAVRNERLRALWTGHVQPLAAGFKEGLTTLWRARRPAALAVSTAAIWGCYALLAYLPLVMLGLAGPYELGLMDAWGLMALGSLGLVVPAPGGIGAYHYVTIQALVYLFAVPEAPAATYAVLTHGAQLVLYVLAGALCLSLQGVSLRAVRRLVRRRAGSSDPA